jgi:hypothetical protein
MARFVVVMGSSHTLLCPRSCSLTQNRARKIRSVWWFASQILVSLGLLLLLTVSALNAQTDPNAGIQMWSTSDFGIDLATSGVNLEIPARAKNGAIPFFSHFFGTIQAYETTAGGSADIEINTALGYLDSTSITIATSLTTIGAECSGGTGTYNVFSHFGVADFTGAIHPLPAFSWRVSNTPGCGTTPAPAVTTDGSGYTLVPGPNGSYAIYDRSGKKWASASNGDGTALAPPLGTVTDPDNNSISTSGGYSGWGTVTDTLDEPVLTANISGGQVTSYSYATASGSTVYYTPAHTTLNWKTNFACPYWGEGYVGINTASLLTSLTRPDGAQYTFAYEPTPNGNGFTNNGTYYTGRIAKVTFPTGGSVSYAYSGGNNGFNCNSGVVPTIKVTVNDNNGHINTWTYVNSDGSATPSNFTVTKTDPAGNQTVYSFAGEYQTQSAAYEGNCPTSVAVGCNGGNGTLLRTITTCYNAIFTSCATPSAVPTLPLSQADVYTSYNGSSSENLVEIKFDTTYGNITEVKQYDFGATIPPRGTPLSDMTITHAGLNGVSCGTVAPYQYDRPCSITTTALNQPNNMMNQVSQVNYTYANGHPTQTSTWVSGSNYLTSSATYNNNGTVNKATSVIGGLSTYGYNGTDGCNSLLPTSVTLTGTGLPSGGLATSTEWNCNGAVATQTTDSNGQPTNYTYTDPFWRIMSMADPLGNVTNYTYTPTTLETAMNYNGTLSTSDTLVTSDGLARQIFSQTHQGQGNSTWDTVQTTYGWTTTTSTTPGGPFTTTSMPYPGTQAEPAPSGTGLTTMQNDVTNRPISIGNTGGGLLSNTYSLNDILSVLSPAPSGENNKQVQNQYDGLGRLTSSCAISSTVSGNVACGQSTGSSNGILTTTAYTSGAGYQTVTSSRGPSNQQQRSVTVDGAGRTTQKVTPEGGTWTYT